MEKSLADLTPEEVQASESLVLALLRERFPDYNFSLGSVLEQLIAYPWAALGALSQLQAAEIQNNMSIKAVSENPDADPELVDSLMSNYQVERVTGTFVTGRVAINVTTAVAFVLPATTVFTTGARRFNPIKDYTIVTDAALATGDGVVVYQVGAGQPIAVIELIETVESGATVPQDTRFTVVAGAIPGVVSITAVATFSAGRQAETNTELLNRLEAGIAAKTTADRASITADLQAVFPDIRDISIIGMGDPEMNRDAQNIYGISGGGMVDVYVRTADAPATYIRTLQPFSMIAEPEELVSVIPIPPTTVPGFYRVTKALPTGSGAEGSAGITEISDRGVWRPNTGLPLVLRAQDARFSARQGGTSVRIQDAREATAGLKYDLYFSAMPLLSDIQDYCRLRANSAPGADILVRAPIPCYVSVGITVSYLSGQQAPSADALRQVVADAVNRYTFAETTAMSTIITRAVDSYMNGKGNAVAPLSLRGSLYKVDGSVETLVGTTGLAIQDDPVNCQSRRTVAYYAYPSSVQLTLQPRDTL